MPTSQRPKGITFMAWLAIGTGILLILAELMPSASVQNSNTSYLFDFYLSVYLAKGFIAFWGFLHLIFGFGALALKPWAWGYGVGLQIFSIICGLFTLPLGIVAILLHAWFLYYLYQPNVRRVFGKA